MTAEKDKGWSPYLAGALTGVTMVMSVWIVDKYFGASTTFVRAAGMIEKIFAPERVAQMEYFIKETPKVDWQWMFVVGILLGALVSSLTSGSFRWQAVPDMWQQHFGANRVRRGIYAFVGGVIALFGVRLAGGCPSGHGLSGIMQLAWSGLVSLVFFFVTGVIIARILYGGKK